MDFNSLDTDSKIKIITDIIETICYDKFGLYALDTHRWVETDGFYEVQFEIQESNLKDDCIERIHEPSDIKYLYLKTICGDSELEAEWSSNNPQLTTVSEFIYSCDDYDYNSIFEKLKHFASENNIKLSL